MTAVLRFDRGTLVLEGLPPEEMPEGFVYDERVHLWRAPAQVYRTALTVLHRRGSPYEDLARAYAPLERPMRGERVPRPYQQAALAAWKQQGRRGVVLLPTGAGKTFVALLCIADVDRSALVVVPTLDLVDQWVVALREAFGEPIGILGGGVREVEALTVSTYDSAYLHAERLGDRFGLLVFDEVHHLPSPSYALAATSAIAPFRLGLTATMGPIPLDDLVGPVVYERGIRELAGDFLAPYRTEVVPVALTSDEQTAYDEAMAELQAFRDENGIARGRAGFRRFLMLCGRSEAGRRAFAAFRNTKRIVQRTQQKLTVLGEILNTHRGARCLVFTADNATAYEVSRTFLVPALTHHTDPRERRAVLDAFGEDRLPVIATSRVLNEGVDLPEAEVAVVLSGSATVREHVQRLGRILRPRAGKQAVMYELVVSGTSEAHASNRRRDHDAYR